MAEIYRPTNGIYRCINNSDNTLEYVLWQPKGCFPVLARAKTPYKLHPLKEFRRIDTAGDKLCMK